MSLHIVPSHTGESPSLTGTPMLQVSQHSHGTSSQQNPPFPVTVPHHNYEDLESSSESLSPERVPSSAYHKNCMQNRGKERERERARERESETDTEPHCQA